MASPADFNLSQTEGGRTALCTGDWTAILMGEANERLEAALHGLSNVTVDLSQIGRCDTSGAYGLLKAASMASSPPKFVASAELTRLLELVDHAVKAEPTRIVVRHSAHQLFDRIGRGVIHLGYEAFDTMVFFGHLLVAVGHAFANPRRVRWAACFSLAERAGLDAIPIVSLTTFFIGAVVGLLGANMLTTFGAQVYVVTLIGVAVLREFNVLITALLLAGRSASSFAAEIGAMKMNQEVDAMEVMGVDPFDALVLPRTMSLLLMTVLLTFVADIAGLFGGAVVCWAKLDLGPSFFIQRVQENVGVLHFWVGMSKAPVFALVVAAIGCR